MTGRDLVHFRVPLEVGMPLRELFNLAYALLESANLTNSAASSSSGIENIGHTIPWSYEEYSSEAMNRLEHGSEQEVRDLISHQRVSINDSTELSIPPTIAFTIEPQIVSDIVPLCNYHLIVTFTEGAKTIEPFFTPLFEAFSMNEYMRPPLEIQRDAL